MRARKPDWPALMLPATARAYLDDMSVAEFESTVVPFLEARAGIGCRRYTKISIDAWIDRGARASEPQSADELARRLDNDDDQDPGREGLREQRHTLILPAQDRRTHRRDRH